MMSPNHLPSPSAPAFNFHTQPIQSFCYTMRFEVKHPWHAAMQHRSSLEFNNLAQQMNEEVTKFFNSPQTQFSLVQVQKSRWSSKRIILLFAVKSTTNWDVKELKKSVRERILSEQKLHSVKTYSTNLKIMSIDEAMFQHLMKFGANVCGTCGTVMKTYRGVNPNDTSNALEVSVFLNFVQGMGLALTTTLLFLL